MYAPMHDSMYVSMYVCPTIEQENCYSSIALFHVTLLDLTICKITKCVCRKPLVKITATCASS